MAASRNLRAAAGAAVMCACMLCAAQPRDGGLNEARKEEDAAECRADPTCMRMYRDMLKREAEAEAAYQAKPIEEKLLPWGVIALVAWGIWKWLGRKP